MISKIAPFEDHEELLGVSRADEIKTAKAILRITREKLDSVREKLESEPKRNPGDLKEDPVFLLGFINGLKFVTGLKVKAQQYLDMIEERKIR